MSENYSATEVAKLIALDEYLNTLITEVKAMTLQMDTDLAKAKEIAHTRKIEINRKLKKISATKAALTPTDLAVLREIQLIEEQYSYKSQSKLQAEMAEEVAARSA